MTDNRKQLNFTGLIDAIRQVHEHCASQAGRAINVSLTLRNWVIGYYILEYEQRGADRADYGERLIRKPFSGSAAARWHEPCQRAA